MRKALHILGILDELDIDWLSREGRVQQIEPGTLLIREKQPIDYLYILLEGQLSVRVGQNPGKEVAVLLAGEIVGEISFVDTRPPAASVFALQQSYLLAIPRTELRIKLDRDLGFASRFYKAIASFLADRLHVTTARFGYGSHAQDVDADLIEDSVMEDVSLAAVRFDKLVAQSRGDYRMRAATAPEALQASVG